MAKGVIRRFTAGAVAVLLALTWATNVAAAGVTLVSSCQPLTTFGQTYRLTQNLASVGTCFTVANDRITIDLNGWEIVGDKTGYGVINSGPHNSITIKYGEIRNFGTGVDLGLSSRVEVRDVEVTENAGPAIIAGDHSLVVGSEGVVLSKNDLPDGYTECTIDENGGTGIKLGDFGQVQGCKVGEFEDNEGAGEGSCADNDWNNGNGILGGKHMLITANIVSCNWKTGIDVGAFSVVTNNVANLNGQSEGTPADTDVDGIRAGVHSQVTGNTANENLDNGIEVVCASTVTNNAAVGNGGLDINPIGTGCYLNNNNGGE